MIKFHKSIWPDRVQNLVSLTPQADMYRLRYMPGDMLFTLKDPSIIAADNTFIFYFFVHFFLLKKIRLDVSCESSAAEDSHKISSLILSEKQ